MTAREALAALLAVVDEYAPVHDAQPIYDAADVARQALADTTVDYAALAAENLAEAGRLLAGGMSADVARAEVHARIGHAMIALAMLQPAPDLIAEAPGLSALERLAAAMEGIAGQGERDPLPPASGY